MGWQIAVIGRAVLTYIYVRTARETLLIDTNLPHFLEKCGKLVSISQAYKKQMNKSFQVAQATFQQNNGVLRFSQARHLGITGATISRMTSAGLLVKESRGIYRLETRAALAYPDFVSVALRVPNAVICLISALHFYQLTTQIPHQVYVALPRNRTKAPRITYPPLHIITLNQRPYSAGIDVYNLDDVPVKIYSMEKTITDCFKFRNLIGHEVALEALKTYFTDHKPQINDLLHFAKINRVEKTIRPYIEMYL